MTSPVDPDTLAEIVMTDDESVLKELYGDFLELNASVADDLMALVAAADLDGVVMTAHRLRSSAGLIGAKGLHVLAGDLESAGRAKDLDQSLALCKALHGEFQRVIEWLTARIA